MDNLGNFVKGDVVRWEFNTYNLADPPSPTNPTANGDPRVYQDGSATAIGASDGLTLTIGFDSVTGKHSVEIDTSVAAYENGREYRVSLDGMAVAGVTPNKWAFRFKVGVNAEGVKQRINPDGAGANNVVPFIGHLMEVGDRVRCLRGTDAGKTAIVIAVSGNDVTFGPSVGQDPVSFNLDTDSLIEVVHDQQRIANFLTAAAAAKLEAAIDEIEIGTVDNTALTATTTIFQTSSIAETDPDVFIGRIGQFTKNAAGNPRQKFRVYDYELVGGRGQFEIRIEDPNGNQQTGTINTIQDADEFIILTG